LDKAPLDLPQLPVEKVQQQLIAEPCIAAGSDEKIDGGRP